MFKFGSSSPPPPRKKLLTKPPERVTSRPEPRQGTTTKVTPATKVKSQRKRMSLTIGPSTIIVTLIAFLAVGAWAVFATSTLMFGDQLSARLIAQQSDMQFAYEQKLIVFRAQLDRIAQQARSDRGDVEGRITDLMLRQAQLEARQGMLLSLAGEGGNTTPGAPPRRSEASPPSQTFAVLDKSVPPHERLSLVEQSINKIEALYATIADSFVLQSRIQLNALQNTLTEMGVNMAAITPPSRPTGLALPKSLTDGSSPFETGLAQARRSFGDLGKLRQAASSMPLLRPVSLEMRMSSPFGIRIHPIYKSERLHAGLDFAVPEGTPIRAAGGGVVYSASVAGGYGNLIIVDHGNGVTTRYAHLSMMLVQPGQPVTAGMTIGRSGNTGASTGPHLHYETRVRDEPKDPYVFITAGEKMLPAS